MISPGFERRAMHALHRVLIHARFMALQDAPATDLATVLDWAELLPTFVAAPVDRTLEFRNTLETIAERFPQCRSAVAVFDGLEPIDFVERRQANKAASKIKGPGIRNLAG
jgi:hypothetical protein